MVRHSVLKHFTALTAVAFLTGSAFAQEVTEAATDDKADEPALSLEGRTEKLSFNTDEGTWISLDITPDGQTIIFELLGDLYSLPITGGDATAITRGLGYDSQPRISPDGQHLTFISDREGNDNLWIADIDGENAREVSSVSRTRIVSPEWSIDGDYVAVTDIGSSPNISLFHREGGSGLALKAKDSEDGINGVGAAMAPDGNAIYFAEPTGEDFPGAQIMRFERDTGRVSQITQGEGGGLRPAVSPDGTKLAYITRTKAGTQIRLRDLGTGADTLLATGVQRDAQENRRVPSRDYFPGYAFTPDSSALITTKLGKIVRIDLATGNETPIPFNASVELDIGPDLTAPYRVEEGEVTAQIVHDPKLSPNGEQIATSVLGKIYLSAADGSGEAERLTDTDMMEFNPVWSPDGRSIAFVTWSDLEGGHIWSMRANGRGQPKRLTEAAAFYTDLDWSPDGETLVAMRGNEYVRHQTFSEFGGLATPMSFVRLPASGGAVSVIRSAEEGERDPHFGAGSDRIFAYSGKALISMTLSGEAERKHLVVEGPNRPGAEDPLHADKIVARPTGGWAVSLVNDQVWVMPMPPVGADTPTVNVRSPALPTARLTDTGADFVGWSEDGEQVVWALGSSVFSRRFDSIEFSKPEDDEDSEEDETTEDEVAPELNAAVRRTKITVTVPRETPEGAILLSNATLITMDGDTTEAMAARQESMDILVVNNRIEALGQHDSLIVPSGASIADMSGKTIIPGLVDTHAHWEFRTQDVLEPHNWSLAANLAYGVTSGLDVQTSHKDYFTYRDFVDAGMSVGQRAFMTGPGVFGNTDFESYERTLGYLKRYSDFYGTSNIKAYLTGNRQQRHWVVRASKELGLMPTTEGAADLRMDITHAIDGMHGNEHTLPILPLRRDVLELYAQTQTAYTATLVVQYQALGAIDYFFTRHNPYEDEKLARFYPENRLDELSRRRRGWAIEEEYDFAEAAGDVAALQRAGGLVGIGGHGELQGLGYHWEMQAHAVGGMTPAEILRAATIDGAKIIGIAQDLGSIEVGKLADMVILNSDPLEDITNATDIEKVMKNGVLYEGDTLSRVWPDEQVLAPFWWTVED